MSSDVNHSSEMTAAVPNMSTQHTDRLASFCVCCGDAGFKKSPAILMPFIAHRTFGWEPVQIDESWGLNTIQKGLAYSICNSMLCGQCGLLFLDIRFSDKEMGQLYKDYRGPEYTTLRDRYEPGYADRNASFASGISYLDSIENFLRSHLTFPISILDWGGDTGKNTPFKDQSKKLDIYDISEKENTVAGNKVNLAGAQSHAYDLIVCSNVLEHVPYPASLLADIIKCMDDQTLLYIEVPFENIMKEHPEDPHLHKRHWHEHINFFSEQSLRHLISGNQLRMIDFKILEVSSEGKPASLFQMACKRL